MAGATTSPACATGDRESALQRYYDVRAASERLCEPLAIEDYGLQSMPDASPAKWHVAHTTWFFETFLLMRFARGYQVFDPDFDHLFNSYYLTHGQPYPRPQRGLLSRPTVDRVYQYRRTVDEAITRLIRDCHSSRWDDLEALLLLGIQHEQQHQELLLTDLKHAFAHNPLRPAYRDDLALPAPQAPGPMGWTEFSGGLREIGAGPAGFAYDNELPRHRVWLEDFALADRPVSNAEFLAFIDDDGYRQPRWWLSEGWATVQQQGWDSPLYWQYRDGQWWHLTLGGLRRVDPAAPVCHVSHYEADAYAAWAGRRLPREAEWEAAAAGHMVTGNLREAGHLQPVAAAAGNGLRQLFGDVWEWTSSAYAAYPGFRIADGPVGEYNGKFMSGQVVLRGGSCVTPTGHVRASYRNFFHPGDRWQFSGIRLADDR